MRQIRAIIADDHAAFRRSLRQFVQTIDDIELVGEAADGQAALELTIKLRPQLVLMDICMPRLNGLDSCRAMKRDNAALTVVLYSAAPLGMIVQGVADLCLNKEYLFDQLPAWIHETFSCSQRLTGPNLWPHFIRRGYTIPACFDSQPCSSVPGLRIGAALC